MTNTHMQVLARVQYRHGYAKNGLYPWLEAAPTQDSLRTMRNVGLLVKPAADGFRLLFDAAHAGGRRSREQVLNGEETLRLHLKLKDPFFYNYTVPIADDISRTLFYFFSRPGQPFLHAGELVSEKDLLPYDNAGGAVAEKPFGVIELRLEQGLEEECYILFPAALTWWNYVLMSEELKSLQGAAIIHNQTGERFTGPAAVRLPDEREGLSFLSAGPMPLQEAATVSCSLVENFDPATGKYKTVIGRLPVPDVRTISCLPRQDDSDKNEKMYSDIFLY